MKLPLTKQLEEKLNRKGKICILPLSYAIELWVNLCELIFCKREAKS